MARSYKRWEDHSPRWQREQSRNGLDKKRWNAWLKLSEKTRRTSDPVKYAAGTSVASQSRERKEATVVARLMKMSHKARLATIKAQVQRMTSKDLDWTLKATDGQIAARASRRKIDGYIRNPWWYR